MITGNSECYQFSSVRPHSMALPWNEGQSIHRGGTLPLLGAMAAFVTNDQGFFSDQYVFVIP